MSAGRTRRALLRAGAVLPLAVAFARAGRAAERRPVDALAALERTTGGRLGVCAIDTDSGARVGYRDDERFPFCSTFKLVLAAAALDRDARAPGFLDERLAYQAADVVPYSPISGEHVGAGMTVAALCDAAVRYSDNTAANVVAKRLGGPAAVTAFARSIGDATFRLDRPETALNTAVPDDPRDTTTPSAMAATVRRLVVDDALPAPQRARLQDWLRNNTTGDRRIRAGVPSGWAVGDKTGTGDRGTANDVGVLWRPGTAPLVLVVFHTFGDVDARPSDAVVAAATRIAVG